MKIELTERQIAFIEAHCNNIKYAVEHAEYSGIKENRLLYKKADSILTAIAFARAKEIAGVKDEG